MARGALQSGPFFCCGRKDYRFCFAQNWQHEAASGVPGKHIQGRVMIDAIDRKTVALDGMHGMHIGLCGRNI